MSQRQCLPLNDEEDSSSGEEEDYDLNQISALQYLKSVKKERERIPEIVTIQIPAELEIESINKVDHKEEKVQHDTDPTKEWQQIQTERFESLQAKIAQMRSDSTLNEKIVQELPFDPCNEEEEENVIKYCETNEPLLSILLAMNQGHLEQLMEILTNHLTENVEKSSFLESVQNSSDSSWVCLWIFSTLACLATPLVPEVHYTIRVIAKACIQVTNHLKSLTDTPSSLIFLPYNLLLVVIAKNFHQFDLMNL